MDSSIVGKIVRVLSSFGLGVVLLLLLLLMTYLGTIYQVEHGLHAAVQKYFEAEYVVHYFGPVPVILPGAYLLLVLFFINLLFGGIVRTRWSWSRAGVLIAHLGIFFLLFGNFVALKSMVEGNLTLYEGEQADEYRSHHDWEIAIAPAPQLVSEVKEGPHVEYLIPGREFEDLGSSEKRTFRSEGIPFTLTVKRYMKNSWPVNAARQAPTNPVIEGVFLEERRDEKQSEANLRGVYVDIEGEGGVNVEGLLWGGGEMPLLLKAGGERWAVELRKVRYRLPFAIRLDKFHHERHPGMGMAKAFKSDVTKIENGQERQLRIQMNQPLRDQGFTLFQSGWGPEDAKPGAPLYSSFSVVTNPADQWPLIACIVISFGMLIHFGRVLIRYLKKEMEKRA